MDENTELIESWDKFFNPGSVAVVGASNSFGKWGFIIPMNLVLGDYKGDLYMINQKSTSVLALPTLSRLSDIGKPVDLVVVTVPAPLVSGVVDQCAEIGTKNMVVISSGFSEMSEEGKRLEIALIEKAKDYGIRLIGPNTMGISSPPSNLFAMGSFVHPPAGNVAFISQSGNLGVQLLGWANKAGLGISRFIGSGNEAVISSDQILEYYGADPDTKVILMYLEGIENGQRFLNVARKITPKKPIILLKVGVTTEGARAASSHSGAVSTAHRVTQAMIKQAGIIEARSTEELVNLARTFGHLPVPKGRKVGIMTAGGGWGVVTTDSCARNNLKLSQPSPETIELINQFLPKFWSHGNPVDLVGTMNRATHFAVLEAMVQDPMFDSIITMGSLTGVQFSREYTLRSIVNLALKPVVKRYGWQVINFFGSIFRGIIDGAKKKEGKKKSSQESSQTGGVNLRDIKKWDDRLFADEVKRLMLASGKPIVPVPFDPDPVADIFKHFGLVAFGIPEEAVAAIAKLTDYHLFLKRIKEEKERITKNANNTFHAKPVMDLLKDRKGTLSEYESKKVLLACDIDVTHEIIVTTSEEAVTAAKEIGFPIVMKITSPDIAHKSDAGCVIVNIDSEESVIMAFDQIMENGKAYNPKARIDGVLVQEMVKEGTEVLLGISKDASFGHTIVFGLGGIYVEVLNDVSLRILPIELPDAEAMINEIRGAKILEGARRQKSLDIRALSETIKKVADLAWSLGDRMLEMDINPLVVLEEGKGVKALDALIVLDG